MCKASLNTPMVVHLVQREVAATLIGTWDCRDLWTRGVLGSSFNDEFLGDFGVANPDVHLAVCCQAKELFVFVREGVHCQPWRDGIDTVNSAKERDG